MESGTDSSSEDCLVPVVQIVKRKQKRISSVDQKCVDKVLDYFKSDNETHFYLVKWTGSDNLEWKDGSSLPAGSNKKILELREKRLELSNSTGLFPGTIKSTPDGSFIWKELPFNAIPSDPRSLTRRIKCFTDSLKNPPNAAMIEKTFKDIMNKGYQPNSTEPEFSLRIDEGLLGKLSSEAIASLLPEIAYWQVKLKMESNSNKAQKWTSLVNKLTNNNPKLSIENKVNLVEPPLGFSYLMQNLIQEGLQIKRQVPIGCSCESCNDSSSSCCPSKYGTKFAYDASGRVILSGGGCIHECNSTCKCGSDCPNRVVRDGRISENDMCIFMTENGCGWGVKTLKFIKKGSFIITYVGQLTRTSDIKDSKYVYELDPPSANAGIYSVDASNFGNISRFFNHSCLPNLDVYSVWTENADPYIPSLAFFSNKNIEAGTELTIDYCPQRRGIRCNQICLCGTFKCRKFIFW